MKKKYVIHVIILISIGVTFSGISRGDNVDKNTLTQFSTIDALLGGIYDGGMRLNDLARYGDFGLGTFNGLDGEMILLDGRFYRISADGKVAEPDPRTGTPFAAVTFFKTDRKVALDSGMDFDSVKERMDKMILTPNIFYGVKIEGVFAAVKTRSVPRQSKPYKPLGEVVKNQPTFGFTNVKGTMVGFRCPPYVKGVNVPGYHVHFLTEEGNSGGHVLSFTVRKALLQIDETSRFTLILPENKPFYDADLSVDKQTELKKVER